MLQSNGYNNSIRCILITNSKYTDVYMCFKSSKCSVLVTLSNYPYCCIDTSVQWSFSFMYFFYNITAEPKLLFQQTISLLQLHDCPCHANLRNAVY